MDLNLGRKAVLILLRRLWAAVGRWRRSGLPCRDCSGIKGMVLPTVGPVTGPSRNPHGWPSLSALLSASAYQPLVQRTGQVSKQICCTRHHYLLGQRRHLFEAQQSPGCCVIGPFRSKLSAAGNKTLPFNSGIIRSGLETSQGKAFIEK